MSPLLAQSEHAARTAEITLLFGRRERAVIVLALGFDRAPPARPHNNLQLLLERQLFAARAL